MKFSSSPVVELQVRGETLRIEQDNGSMHVGTSVWPCSLVLLKWMESLLSGDSPRFILQGKRGIDLGSGCGVAGLGFALLGLNTLLTDIAPVLPALRRNVKKNVASTSLASAGRTDSFVGKVKIAQLYWGNANQIAVTKPPFDFIIATDVVYLENIVEPLLATFCALAGPSSIILLGYQIRSPEADELFWRLCPSLFHIEKVPREELHPDYAYAEADVFILRKKSSAS
ncbi:hypothetical protein KP509_03G096900 [Ceratopteris richardii]|uniref:Uncharacterized protein n=1 Tax=Ceratopteris richardii TaxID=49495 RepID=A0A8T2VA22_CERRI|nr:hypothetical protein KP509_03G096900 [Ceratopteris richardii]KAH7442623.1 hypothetical protein KP509_03G096900 [Ceratopteris richardii]